MIRDTSKKCVVVALKVRIKLASFLFLFQKCGTPNQGVMISTVYGKKVQPSSRTDSLVDIMPAFVFGPDVRRHVGEGPDALTPQPLLFDKDLRAVTGPHLRKARLKREECRRIKSDAHPFIASSVGFPYTALRDERRFLFDPHHSYPLHQILADTLGVDDLSQLHKACHSRQARAPIPVAHDGGSFEISRVVRHFRHILLYSAPAFLLP